MYHHIMTHIKPRSDLHRGCYSGNHASLCRQYHYKILKSIVSTSKMSFLLVAPTAFSPWICGKMKHFKYEIDTPFSSSQWWNSMFCISYCYCRVIWELKQAIPQQFLPASGSITMGEIVRLTRATVHRLACHSLWRIIVNIVIVIGVTCSMSSFQN